MWLRLPEGLTAERLLEEHRVAVAPGEGSGRAAPGGRASRSPSPTTCSSSAPSGSRRRSQGRSREDRDHRAVLVVLSGRRRRARRAPGRRAPAAWSRCRARDGQRPAREVHAVPASAQRAARAAAGRHHAGRPVGRRARERLAAEHRALAAHRRSDARRARRAAVRRRPPARADDARDLRGDARARAVPDRRHPPRARRPRLDAPRPPLLGLPDGPRSTRGSRCRRWRPSPPGAGSRTTTAIDPERRVHPRRGEPGRPRPRGRLHRPSRPAQGLADPAARVARDPCGDRRAAAADRHRSVAVPPPARAPAVRRVGHRRARHRHQRRADARAAPREGVRHPGARRRELRPRPRRGVRVCHARGRVRHPRVRGSRDAGSRDARAAVRPGCAGGGGRRRALRRGAPRRDGPRGARACARQLRVGRHRATARRGLPEVAA